MIRSAVAKRYAEAFAEVVTRSGSALAPRDAEAQLRRFEEVLAGSRELREALASPAVPMGRKKALLSRLAAVLQLSALTRDFLCVLADHRRMAALPEIVRALEAGLDARLGETRAEVICAREMNEAGRAALGAALERLTGQRVRMHISLDEALLGGAVARIGSTVYDGSLRGRLAALERRMGAED
jgi:F-type H+-transporting ATPase subunit delta